MSTLKRIKKVKDGYEIIVSCTNAPTKTRMFSTSEECHAFADEYLEKNYFGVGLNNIHHPEGDGLVLKDFDPESLEIIDIEIPMNERNLELAAQAGLQQRINDPNEIWGYRADLELFAELVRQDEREANAKLLNDFAKTSMVPVVDSFQSGLKAGAYAILSRGK